MSLIQVSINRADAERLGDDLLARARRGVQKAAIAFTGWTKELVSVPAPRKRVLGRRGGMASIYYHRATTPATPGAPPRKITGRFRSTIGYEMLGDGLRAVVGTNAVQARRLEFEGHPYLSVIAERHADDVVQIVGNEMAA